MEALQSIQTPAFVVRLAVAERNAKRMLDKAEGLGLRLRVNIKTHKTVEGALMQCGGKPRPVVVSTLPEAEMLVENGFNDILYGVPISESKLDRIVRLNARATVHVLVDHPEHIAMLQRYALAHDGMRFSAFVKVDCGYGRAGVPVTREGAAFCVAVAECPFASMARELGVFPPVVSVGSTPSCSVASAFEGVTELHPGNYLFYDRQQMATGAATEDDCAGLVLARVVSHYPDRNRVIVDAGSLALSKDTAPQGGYGHILGHPELTLLSASQEQSIIEYSGPADDIQKSFYDIIPIGGLVKIVPNHACLTAACHAEYLILDDKDAIVDRWQPCKGW